jgi:hypothetical protein
MFFPANTALLSSGRLNSFPEASSLKVALNGSFFIRHDFFVPTPPQPQPQMHVDAHAMPHLQQGLHWAYAASGKLRIKEIKTTLKTLNKNMATSLD